MTMTMDADDVAAVPGTLKEWHNPLIDPDQGRTITAPGPWQTEPSKMQWVDAATSLPCLIVRGPLGQLCGYAGVYPGHPWHGRHYEAVDADVHGGLTFSDKCQPTKDHSRGICHIPEPGTSDNVWWFGFDCAHLCDVVPGMIGLSIRERERGKYRDVGYVANEVRSLAAQLRDVSA
jgi:hypothetical protein